ncbi:MAG: HAD family hydrolase [Nitrospirae bacterium]|nr:HAD family hydrolase [Nitrospirota bacterium]
MLPVTPRSTRISTIALDFVDTLYEVDRSHLPETEFNGYTFRSTIPLTHRWLVSHGAQVELEDYCATVISAYRDAETSRQATRREVLSETIFERILEPFAPADDLSRLAREASRIHMEHLAGALVLPDGYGMLLESLHPRYRLGVVSNFDHSATLEAVFARDGIRGFFSAVIVSADVGWRKPDGRIFEEFTRCVGVSPEEVLFVGDRYEVDVLGAKHAGMRGAWLNPSPDPGAAEASLADLTLRSLCDLPDALARLERAPQT